MKIIIRNTGRSEINNTTTGNSTLSVKHNNRVIKTRDDEIREQYRNSKNKMSLVDILREYTKSR